VPAITYPDGTPPESRWDWSFRVPDAWRSYPPDKIIRYARFLLQHHNLTHNGGPAELATQQWNGDWFFLVKSDVDPATVINMGNLPSPPKTPQELRVERLTLAANALNAGTPLTNAQMQEALKHLIDAYLELAR
jgi:hypothetical protein